MVYVEKLQDATKQILPENVWVPQNHTKSTAWQIMYLTGTNVQNVGGTPKTQQQNTKYVD